MPAPGAVDDFGALVRRHRDRLGLSQEELAERVGIGQSYMSSVERGHTADLYVSLIGRLAEALGVPFVELAQAAASRAKNHRTPIRTGDDTDAVDIACGATP